MTSTYLVRLIVLFFATAGCLTLASQVGGQVGTRPPTAPPASAAPSGSAGSRFAAPPASSGTDRVPATGGSSAGSGGLIGSGASGSGGIGSTGSGFGGSSGIPRTTSPAASGSGSSGVGGGTYGGTLPSTGDSGPAFGGTTGGASRSTGPAYGGSSSGSAFGGSSGSSSLGTPSSVIPRTPPSSAPRGGLPYDATPTAELPSDSSDGDEPAIGSRSGDAVGMNGVETTGYALIGPTAHHYIFGNLAVADYIDRGQRRIVTLEQEMNLPKDDPNFMYYRELRDGNRWAFSTKAGSDRRYAVYFQPAGAAGEGRSSWRRFQRAQFQWSRRIAPAAESMVFE